MRRTIWVLGLLLLLSTYAPAVARAGGGDYVFDGGDAGTRTQVRRALEASSFDWSLVPARIVVHIRAGVDSHATPGHIWLDENLLRAGRFAWAVVQDEYAHQVDFFLLNDVHRAHLAPVVGGLTWFRGPTSLPHDAYGSERFASTLVWAYWQSPDNAYRPRSASDESGAVRPARFRALLGQMLGTGLR